ncbi:hypothetical protein VNO78_35910 [Psophocarpus tetragonolobus]|uniref:Uncharacterized protein n=1 Tax=Psophocarpus tetragonolobus TaxID=3891 RepID=A0AAN9NQP1_PSOTE
MRRKKRKAKCLTKIQTKWHVNDVSSSSISIVVTSGEELTCGRKKPNELAFWGATLLPPISSLRTSEVIESELHLKIFRRDTEVA